MLTGTNGLGDEVSRRLTKMKMKMALRRKKGADGQPVRRFGGFRRGRASSSADQALGSPSRSHFDSWSSTSSTVTNLDDMIDDGVVVTPEERQIVVYKPPASLPESMDCWLSSMDALLRSQELHAVVFSTGMVIGQASSLAFRTVLLPVTLPLHVACTTTDFVVGSTLHVVGSAVDLLGHALFGEPVAVDQERQEQRHRSLTDHVFGLPLMLLGAATDVVMGAVIPSLPAPAPDPAQTPLRLYKKDAYVTPASDDDFLARFRLDFSDTPADGSVKETTMILSSDPSNLSKYLLRVDDLGLTQVEERDAVIHYIDLTDQSDQSLTDGALSRLVACGFSMLANHPTVRLSKQFRVNPKCSIVWKPEGGTPKLLGRMVKMTTLERLHALEKDILVWSGRFEHDATPGNSSFPFFLARGVVEKSPRDFMKLLWDNSRTNEYNNYCLGRTNLLVIEDKVLSGAHTGTKVIRSETRVPFTSLSVQVNCLMHVRPLEAPDEGYVIVSRTLDCGEAGTHLSKDRVEVGRNKNEILWGINILRRVPNHPHLTDLTSLSQVGTTLVPKFLASKIGLMGIEDFFKNVRSHTPISRANSC